MKKFDENDELMRMLKINRLQRKIFHHSHQPHQTKSKKMFNSKKSDENDET